MASASELLGARVALGRLTVDAMAVRPDPRAKLTSQHFAHQQVARHYVSYSSQRFTKQIITWYRCRITPIDGRPAKDALFAFFPVSAFKARALLSVRCDVRRRP
jgi:hypothetical protein